MAEYEDFLDNGKPNVALGRVCDNLFYDLKSSYAGCIGVKNLGTVLSAPEQEFCDYLTSEYEELTQ